MHSIRLAFLGQCFVFGYRGVPRHQTYPEIVKRRIEAARPGIRVVVAPRGFYHPAELHEVLLRTVRSVQPHAVIVDAAANTLVNECEAVDVAMLPKPIGALVQQARHVREVSKGVIQTHLLVRPLLHVVETVGRTLVDGPLHRVVHRHGRPTLTEYERALEDAIVFLKESRGPALVLQGPSAFNPDESDKLYASNAPDVYRLANAVVRRLAATHGVLLVDRMAVVDGCRRSVFLDGHLRLSSLGHEMLGHTLAEALLRSGLI